MTFHSLSSLQQLQLASLEESKQQSKKTIQDLQKNIQVKEMEVQALLSLNITAREGQQTNAAQVSLEMADMKTRMIALEEEISSLQTAVKVSQEEASCYQEIAEHATTLLGARPTKVVM